MAWNVVIAGGGFAGATVARELERILPRQSARLVLVNDVNFLLYTPFLPEAAAGTLEPRHVVTPLREILSRTYLRLGSVTARDPDEKTVTITDHSGREDVIPYDHLILAAGSISRFLPIPGLTENAIGFKSLADAIWLRNHVIETLEAANAEEDPERRQELLTYVFIGGGYAGLEAMAELQDLAVDAMESYPRARLQGMRWILVEATDRVLPEIDPGLADYAVRELKGRGFEIRMSTTVEEVTESTVRLSDGETIPTRTAVWTAGVAPNPSLKRLEVPLDEKGRVIVGRDLGVEGLEGVWAAGDCAAVPDPSGGICPPTAQHAVRQAPVIAANVGHAIGIGERRTFDYRANAAFVNLGRYKAVGSIGGRKFRGLPAWWLARTYHLSQIPGVARKIRAVVDWTSGLAFSRDISEVGSIGHPGKLRTESYSMGGSHKPVGSQAAKEETPGADK